MSRPSFLAGAALGLVTVACGGLTAIGERAPAENGTSGGGGDETQGSGGTGGTDPSGTGGTDPSGTGGTGGTDPSGTGGTGGTDPSGTGGSDSSGTGGTGGSDPGGSGGSGATTGARILPCDVLQGAGHACVAAHSTVRALVSDYTGPLYQVERGDKTTLDIGLVDGHADVAAHDAFCSESICFVTILYDQSPFGNHLTPAPPGSAKPTPADPARIGDLEITIDGRSAYGLKFRPGQGYRAACNGCPYPAGPAGTAVGDEPQTIYMLTSQHDLVNGCCLDYGNGEVTRNNDGDGATEAVYFGGGVIWGSGSSVGGSAGPWVMADLENGLYAGWENNQAANISTNLPLEHDFVTALLVGDTADKNDGKGRFALYGGNATSGTLTTMYDGVRPGFGTYAPMRKQGSVILSVAGDNSDGDGGRFYEGVMANGAASKETVDALQAVLVAAGYGR